MPSPARRRHRERIALERREPSSPSRPRACACSWAACRPWSARRRSATSRSASHGTKSSSSSSAPRRISISSSTPASVVALRRGTSRSAAASSPAWSRSTCGVAVAGQIDEVERAAVDLEPVEQARAARRARRAREAVLTGERVDQARLADVRAADDRDLRQPGGGKSAGAAAEVTNVAWTLLMASPGAPVAGRDRMVCHESARAWHCAHSAARAFGVDKSARPSARRDRAGRA